MFLSIQHKLRCEKSKSKGLPGRSQGGSRSDPGEVRGGSGGRSVSRWIVGFMKNYCRARALLINEIVFDNPLYDWLWSKKNPCLKSYDSLLKCPKNRKTHPLYDKWLWCRFPQVLKGLFCENAIFWMFWKDFQRRPLLANSVEFHGIALDSMDFQVLHGIPWKPIGFHGMPWISMEFHGSP